MSVIFQKAVKTQAKLRLALDGPSGSGKTYTALTAATAMANGGSIAVIDTERGSASLYSDKFSFDVLQLTDFNPKNYIEGIEAAEEAGYAVIVIDSLSHAWEGEGGALDMVDDAAARSQSKNSYFAWRDVTPLHRRLVDAMLQSPCHVIATMRSKTEYVVEEIERGGKKTQVPRKIGTAPIQRSGMEYEFTIVGDLDLDHNLVISKSRMESLADVVEKKPGVKFFQKVYEWLNSGEPAIIPDPKPAVTTQVPAPTPINNNGLTLEKAIAITTPKGALLGNLTDEQLKLVAKIGLDEQKKAASFLLADPAMDEFTPWYKLLEDAAQYGKTIPDLGNNPTRIHLHREMEKLIKEIEQS